MKAAREAVMPRNNHRSTRTNSSSSLKRAKNYTYTVIIHPTEPDEKPGFWAEVPALPGCFTQGKTIEQCMERSREAIECYLESLVNLGEPIPEEQRTEDAVIGKVRVNLPLPA